MTRGFWAAASAALLALAACESLPPDVYATGGKADSASAVPIGNNEVGEPCRYQIVSAGEVSGGREAVIYCGTWEQPSGRVTEIGSGSDDAQVMALASSGAWRGYVDQRFSCSAPSPTRILGGSPAALMQCTRRIGGWPHVAMTAAAGGRIYGGDAVRPALPALEATLAALSGQAPAPATAAAGSEALRVIAQRTGGTAFGSGDEGRYFELTRRGDAYDNTDEPAKAEEAYREALAIQQKILGADDPALALTIMKLAAQVAHQQNGPDADALLNRAATLIAKGGDPLFTAQLDYYRAVTRAYEGKTDEAMELSQRAETEFTHLAPTNVARLEHAQLASAGASGVLRGGGVQDLLTDESPNATQERAAISGLAESMRLRATLLQQTGKGEESAALARRTQQLLAANGLSISSTAARALLLLASNEAVAKNYSSAASDSAAAERISGRVVPGQLPEARNLINEGVFESEANRQGAALDSFRRAGAILRSPTVSGGAQPDAVLRWLDALYASSGDKAHLGDEMFEAAQFGRSSLTAQDIAKATARLIGGDSKVADAIRGYEDSQAAYDRLQGERDQAVAAGAAADRIAAIDQRIEAARKARNEAQAVVPAAAPRYLEAEEKPVAASELRGLLAPDEAFFMFFVADGGSYAFLIRPDGVSVYKVPLNGAEIHALVAHLRETTIVRPGGLPTPDFDTAYKLYSALFGPAEAKLAGVTKYIVAATGDLLSYPLEALVTQPGVKVADVDYRQVPFLVRKAALSYVPAARVLVNLRHAHSTQAGTKPFIGFGDFRPASAAQLAASFPPGRCHDDYEALRQLEPLPKTRDQVTTIARQVGAGPGDVVLGDAFNKARLKSPDLAQYRIILLATHAFLPDTLGCFNEPAIVLSPPPRAANADGEFERAGEIGDLKLDADLVALSACDTSGAGGKGESLSGLARAFFRAGAKGLLVSHWDVVTGASVPLMVGTFGAAEHDSAQALRAAQLRMIDTAGSDPQKSPIELSHPNYWAAFVLIGDGVRNAPGA
ncbi:MAG TPA: CHAT domain-containing tetratricopeptide repeat protein [Stellaceae bacterium]|jgi:CHAT domain-containing protein|nr:CHAT domain-containing tetratricopeptide repeat protein [Stellaceae bacterium]